MKLVVAALAAVLFGNTLVAQNVDPRAFAEMRWRMIGPFRGGRTVAAVGVPQQPNVFYIGVNNGGVWKTTDYGRIWTPIFDSQPTGSVGAIAVAPSDPNVIYVGSGEGLQRPDLSTGDGIYKSVDAGRTWQHLGLRDGQQIPAIVVDPHDPNRLFVAVLGHPYGPNPERGIYRSLDGGRTFEKVLYKDENTGGMDVIFDPSNAQTVYADLWAARQGPWENGTFRGATSGVYKSTDGGTTWRRLTNGLPSNDDGLSRVGLEVAPADPKRLYAVVGATKKGSGIYRSDDGGESWRVLSTDERLWGRDGDFNEVRSDPKNADVVYIANVASWKSTDGGKTWAMFRGAPGGDDYHRFWINPNDPKTILLASDQGAVVTVNGGETWSSWYNQPTAQFYHVNTDNAFPYRVCGGQQESGSACVVSRSDEGRITFRDWTPVGVEEYGYAVPDPLDPDTIYGGRITRFDRRTRQVQIITPKPIKTPDYRVLRTAPVAFSPVDPHTLFFAANTLWKTTNGGQSWTEISPDLTRKTWAVPENVGIFRDTEAAKPKQRGVIYAIAPSPLSLDRLWAGTDDGLIHVTTDGGTTWKDVTPPQLRPWAKVSVLEASHFDANTAYAAINTFRLDDLRPHILRTRDGGATWTEIVSGIPAEGIVNVVREDPKRRGLLFAGSEREVFVSFDDGDHWQSLRLNMPATSIRDLVLHEDDVVVGTHGRGFWILDDIEPLRQVSAPAPAATTLFRPQRAWRFRWNKNTDTPLPPDEPAGENPPDGAIVDYYLAADAKGPVTLEVLDASNHVIRRYASNDPAPPPQDTNNVPWYWIRPARALPATAGMHRFVWDLHYTPSPGLRPGFPIAATPHDTPRSYTSPWVLPGTYTVRLTADGQTYTQPLTVTMDPRVTTSAEGLRQQFELSREMYDGMLAIQDALTAIRGYRARMQEGSNASKGVLSQNFGALNERLTALSGDTGEDADDEEALPEAAENETLVSVFASLRATLSLLQSADLPPTDPILATVADRRQALAKVLGEWRAVQKEMK